MTDKTTDAYNIIAEDYNKRNYNHFWPEEYKFYKSIISGNKIIDLGCGTGRDAEVFVKDNFDYLGIDSSKEMLKIAKERVAGGRFELMDLRSIHLPLESFDGFWASASLLHFPKKEVPTILKSFHNLLKNNGVGFISLKEKRGMDEGVIKEEKCEGIERYFSFFTEEEMDNFLKNAGFSILKHLYLFEEVPSDTKWLCFFVKKG